jgi:feruloyl esterase
MAEVWLPDRAKWNGKFLGIGNGGFGGSVSGPARDMRMSLAHGYATAGDDLGHEITSPVVVDGRWAIGHPEKVKDFAFRADHVTAEFAKALIAAYYGRPPQFSYFRGCSNGGHEALMEAERYPADYDGIVAGAPANSWTHIMAGFLWNETALFGKPESQIPQGKLAVIQDAVLAQCDTLDGVKDGIINDPAMCHFDPAVLLCKSGDAPNCLTHPQLDALRKIYTGPVNPRTGKSIYPGFPAGSEGLPHNWDFWITGPKAAQPQFGNQFFGSFVVADPKWDFRTFDFDRDVARTDAELGPIINSNNPDLKAFAARGGKLILFQGWADAAITPWGTIQYYRDIQQKMHQDEAQRFVRLFMAPGMMHCSGGPGPNTFDAVAAIEQWREKNEAPETIIAARYADPSAALAGKPLGEPLSTRPLCAYPKVAHWIGKGSPDEAQNYACRAGAGDRRAAGSQ